MEDPIRLSNLNDFGFCPVSVYFHNVLGEKDRILTQTSYQINGTNAHSSVDLGTYSSRKSVLQGIDVYCDKYGIYGKIDIYYMNRGLLVERKKKISRLFDSQIFQLYGQYFSLCEMGYDVKALKMYSMDDNKGYDILLPSEDPEMMSKFEKAISDMRNFDPRHFIQENQSKCDNCIYEVMCSSAAGRSHS